MRNKLGAAILSVAVLAGAALFGGNNAAIAQGSGSVTSGEQAKMAKGDAIAIFAGGCFWCMEQAMEGVPGVKDAISGYIGGTTKNPTYRQVSAGITGHTEAVKVIYDPAKVNYQALLKVFWLNIDPLVANRQFCDGGSQYRAGIFYLNDEQKVMAQASKAKLIAGKKFKAPIVTEVTMASEFYPAEKYHQAYYKKNPIRYNYYKYSCGRQKRLDQLWGAQKKSS